MTKPTLRDQIQAEQDYLETHQDVDECDDPDCWRFLGHEGPHGWVDVYGTPYRSAT